MLSVLADSKRPTSVNNNNAPVTTEAKEHPDEEDEVKTCENPMMMEGPWRCLLFTRLNISSASLHEASRRAQQGH